MNIFIFKACFSKITIYLTVFNRKQNLLFIKTINSRSYNKAQIKPFLNSHMGIIPNPRNSTTLAYSCFSQRLGGQLIGFKIMGAQTQNTSPNVRLKKGLRSRPSTSVGPLMASPKHRPKTRAQVTPSKG